MKGGPEILGTMQGAFGGSFWGGLRLMKKSSRPPRTPICAEQSRHNSPESSVKDCGTQILAQAGLPS
eukprot:3834425-Amphidinium_carterae.1